MRTRTRSNVLSATAALPAATAFFTGVQCDGSSSPGSGPHPAYAPWPLKVETETMSDSVGRGQVNPVKHRKMLQDTDVTALNAIADGNGAGYYVYNSPNLKRYGYSLIMGDVVGLLTNWDMGPTMEGMPTGWTIDESSINETQVAENLIAASHQLKADVLLNVVEANQIWPSIKSLTSALPAMAANWNRLRKVLSVASGSYLAWKFGVGPILQDLKSIATYAPDMGNQFSRFAKQDKARFTRVIPLNATFLKTPTIQTATNGNVCRRTTYQGRQLGKAEVRYVLVVQPNVPAKTDFFKKLNFVMARFTSSPASLAWELVPFSFVVDWFVDLRGVLRSLDNLITVQPYKIVGFSKSLRYALATDGILECINACPSAGGAVVSRGTVSVEYRHYERSSFGGQATLPVFRSRFGKNQAAISAALITQALTKARANRF